MTASIFTGGCFCGSVRFRIEGAGRHPCYCHCESCRRAAGAPFVAWATFDAAAFQLTRGELDEHRSSPGVVRGHCRACGTSLTYRHEKRPEDVDVTIPSLDDPGELAPRLHIWVQDKPEWIVIADGLPRYASVSSGEPIE